MEASQELQTYEDINNKFGFNFSRDRMLEEPITEEEIIQVFRNNEFISEDFLKKSQEDRSGIYYNICGLWYLKIKNNIPRAYDFLTKSADLGCTHAMFTLSLKFTNNWNLEYMDEVELISREKSEEYCEYIIEKGNYPNSIFSVYALNLIYSAISRKNICLTELNKIRQIIFKGMELCDSGSFIACSLLNIALNNCDCAEYFLNIGEKLALSDPNIHVNEFSNLTSCIKNELKALKTKR